MYTPQTIAKAMLEEANGLGLSLTNLKLQKLLYLAHGSMLAKFDRPLIGEQFSAWKYGPVLESLYHDLKLFGSNPIQTDNAFLNGWEPLPENAQDERNVIRAILNQFGRRSAGALVELTHREGGPWAAIFDEFTNNLTIDDGAIKEYFRRHLKQPVAG